MRGTSYLRLSSICALCRSYWNDIISDTTIDRLHSLEDFTMNRSLIGVFLLFFLIALVIAGAFYGGIAYVVIHFVNKFW